MPLPADLIEVPGAQALYDWFGYWPSFHDAEVIALNLDRSKASTLTIHTWEMTDAIDEKGFYVLAKHVLVEFTLSGIRDLQLNGFNHQNVIFELVIKKKEDSFEVVLADCYGLSGFLVAERFSIRHLPSNADGTLLRA